MSRRSLHLLEVKSPCPQEWNGMDGSERVRHCGKCDHDVENLSSMTEEEATTWLATRNPGHVCVRVDRDNQGRCFLRSVRRRSSLRARRRRGSPIPPAFAHRRPTSPRARKPSRPRSRPRLHHRARPPPERLPAKFRRRGELPSAASASPAILFARACELTRTLLANAPRMRRYVVLAGLAFLSQGCGHLSSRDAHLAFAIIELGAVVGDAIVKSSPPPSEPERVEHVVHYVPVSAPPTALPITSPNGRAFNRDAAASAFAVAASFARDCRSYGGPNGEGRLSAVIETSGTLSIVRVDAPFAGTEVGECWSKTSDTSRFLRSMARRSPSRKASRSRSQSGRHRRDAFSRRTTALRTKVARARVRFRYRWLWRKKP